MADQQAGWYPDPSGNASKLRYWDGTQWTNNFSDAQAQSSFTQQAQPVQQPVQPMQPQVVVSETPYNTTGGQTRIDPVYMQAPPAQSNGKAVAALICGIAGLCIGFAAIAAIILGVMGRKSPVQRGMATAGLVLGIIGVVGWAISLVVLIIGAVTY